MLKNLPEGGIQFSTSIIEEYWTDMNCHIKMWSIQKLIGPYKGKHDMQNINNWRGIC